MSSSFGRLALGVVGAVIGSFFGVPGIGFAIGSAIGGFIFAPEGPTVEGPRLGDTDVTGSTVGKIITESYGTTRVGGNMIWSGGLKEVKKEEEQGGKGGGGTTTVSYSYSASFAIALGRGSAEDVLRIWADGKLIYDVTGDGSVKNDKYSFRLRRGSEDPATDTTPRVDPLIAESINRRLAGLPDINEGNQEQASYKTIDDIIAEVSAEPDPRSAIYASYLTTLKTTAEAAGGTPPDYMFTPAYKEVTYIVFEDMPLDDFGNRIPNITAEIVWTTDTVIDPNATVTETVVGEISAETAVPPNMMGVDGSTRSALVISGGTELRRFSLGLGAESVNRAAVLDTGITAERVLCSTSSGDWIVRGSRPSGSDKLYKLDNISLTLKSSNTDEMALTAAAAQYGCNAGLNGATDAIAYCDASGNLAIADVGAGQVRDMAQILGAGLGPGPMVYGGGESGDYTVFWASQNGTNFNILKVDIKFPNTPEFLSPVDFPETALGSTSVTVTTMGTVGLAGGSVSAVLYSFQAGRAYVVIANSGGGGTVYEYDPDAEGTAGDPYLQATNTFTGTPPSISSGLSRSGTSGGTITFANGDDAYVVDLGTGEEVVYTDALSATATANAQVFEPATATLFTWVGGVPTLVRFNSLNGGLFSNDLASIVTDVCQRVGMLPDEFDTTAIAGLHNVRGYTIGRPSNGRKVLEKLFQAYFVDGIESDWKIKFQPQQNAPVRLIEESELGRTKSPTGDVPFLETRVPEQDLPAEVSIIFTDPDRDYQQGSGHYKRTSQPTPSMYSKKVQNIELPLVLSETEGRSICERILFLAWMSRDQGKALLPWSHIDLDPADVVQFKFDDGRTLTNRISNMQIGANFEIETDSVRSGDPVFAKSESSPFSSANIPTNGILTPSFSKLFVLDMPLLYDYHDLNRASMRYYTAVGSDTSSFTSADLYQSLDGQTYVNFDSINADCTWGTITSGALGSPTSLHSTDYDNTFTVALSVDNGDLSSVTYDDIVNGIANRAVIINTTTGDIELIQFQNVTANVDGTYTFDTLVRGRRGTDYAVSRHEEGEVFILVNDATVIPQINDLSSIGTTRYFKAVSRGGLLATSPPVGELMEGRDLKPYAPNYVRRTDDATDLTVLWNRRTRVGGIWNMSGTGVEEVPLSEDFEQYEIYLLPNSPTALDDFNPLDTETYELIKTVGTQQAVITAAELAAASYTLADDVNVAVYQLSAQVGRGFGRIVALAP